MIRAILFCLVFINPHLSSSSSFPSSHSHKPFSSYPFFVSAVHMFCSAILAIAYLRFTPSDKTSRLRQWHRVIPLSLLITLNVGFGNAGLRFASVTLREVIRGLVPAVTMLLSVIILGRRYGLPLVAALIPVTLGAMLCAYGDGEFTWLGFWVVAASAVLAGAKGVCTYLLLIGAESPSPVSLLAQLSPLAAIQLLVLSFFTGEIDALSQAWAANTIAQGPVAMMVILSGVMAFALNWSNFQASKDTSPLTVSVAAVAKQALTIGLAFIFFAGPFSSANAGGALLAVLGTGAYQYQSAMAEWAEARKRQAQPPPHTT